MPDSENPHADVVTGHERRLATVDPWLPHTHPLPDPEPDEPLLTTGGAVGIARRERPDPESFLATWGAADQHGLAARVAGSDPVRAMADLLDQWAGVVRQRTTGAGRDPDSEAGLTWPSRDAAMTGLFLARGLVPKAVIAARPPGRAAPALAADASSAGSASGTGAWVRPMEAGDLDRALALWLEEVRWDAQFGTAVERPSTVAALRRRLTDGLTREPRWTWVSGTGSAVDGLLVLSPPADAQWVAPAVSPAPAAYLDCLSVAAGRRGAGVGAALVRQAHTTLDATGVAVTLLHYAALNPLSGPFWHRCGYRPLWTSWGVRPAWRLAAG